MGDFSYYTVGATTSKYYAVTEVDLAAYVMTEWLPNVPISAINGFAEVLLSVLQTYRNGRWRVWAVKPELAYTDKQWKGTTSWLLGVAFTRWVLERERYPWWSPVSAFTNPGASISTRTGTWLSAAPRTWYSVQKKLTMKPQLMPDYVACRLNTISSYDYAFVESKGCNKNIARMTALPDAWYNQLNSIDLFCKGYPVAVARRLLVATRVSPQGSSDKTRSIVVRAWNSAVRNDREIDAQFVHFLANHYSALCWRLGFQQLARVLETAGVNILANSPLARSDWWFQDHVRPGGTSADELLHEFDGISFAQHEVDSQHVFFVPIAEQTQPARLLLDGHLYSAAITPAAMSIMRAIVSQDLGSIRNVVSRHVREIEELNNRYHTIVDSDIRVLLNGVAVYRGTEEL